MNGSTRKAASTILACVAVVGLLGVQARATFAAPRPSLPHLTPVIQIRPASSPAGTVVGVRGKGFNNICLVSTSFTDPDGTVTLLKGGLKGPSFKTSVTIPPGAALGAGYVGALQLAWDPVRRRCNIPAVFRMATFATAER